MESKALMTNTCLLLALLDFSESHYIYWSSYSWHGM
jgi:hypothetical protein